MWKDYSRDYIKNNRSSGLSVRIAAFISALLLSLLCGLFYNVWKYEVERIKLEEGGWQSRLIGEFDREDIESIRNFSGVEDVVVNEKGSANLEAVIDIYFANYGDVFVSTPLIARGMGISSENTVYNYELLAMYLIRNSADTAPRLLFPAFLLITIMASASLILIIHNSFAVTMNARTHQIGILSSIGATPGQIRKCLLQEAAVLCTVPVIIGNLLGIAVSAGLLQLVNRWLGNSVAGRHEAVFGYHPLALALTLLVTAITVLISAWLPARRLSRMTPLEAIRNTEELQLKRKRNSPILIFLFGVEGELAGNALKAQRKALRTASLSLLLSFMAFTLMQCCFTLSKISTRETYFEKYQDAWDIMITVKGTGMASIEETETLRGIPGVKSVVAYQKATAKRLVSEDEISEEMKSLGGFSHAADSEAVRQEDGWLVNAPIIILDDESFLDYCEQIGTTSQLEGAVIRNRIRDVTNPDFRHPEYMPYIKGESSVSVLQSPEGSVEIPVLSCTEEVPVLREEYATKDYYELVHFVPLSLWKEIKGQIPDCEKDTYIRILGGENASLEELSAIQKEIDRVLAPDYTIISENRIQERETNDSQIQGMLTILGSFCVLLAVIGIGNVFSNTLGFVRQRKREFARYMSVGITPKEIRRMFCIEALVIAGRPVLLTLPLAVLVIWYLLKKSYMEAGIFLAELPFVPIGAFILAIWGTVALAYYLGWQKVRRINLAEVLRDDSLM